VPNLKYANILIARTDRIGDVVLTLPLVRVLRKEFPEARISFLVRTYTKEIVEGQPGINRVVLYDTPGGVKPFFSMLSEFRQAKFDAAVVAFPRFRLALLLWLARVPDRVGSGYRWYSFLFSKRVYEHRKTAQRHEFEYNLSLLRSLGCTVPTGIVPSIEVAEPAKRTASAEMKRLGLPGRNPLALLHPGSGGSARDWSPQNFGLLARALCDAGWDVVVTGASGEEALVCEVVERSGGTARSSVGVLTLNELAAFIKLSRLFVSNSTGPLHIAAAVGTPVIGFYPSIVACSPNRWGPITEEKVIFVPDRTRCSLCKGGPCRASVCMDQISVQDVVAAALHLTRTRKTRRTTKSPVYQ
jgi:heptosyltransferase-3